MDRWAGTVGVGYVGSGWVRLVDGWMVGSG